MKKSIFCVLFALLVSLSAVAAAENTGCCACCSGANCASIDNAAEDDNAQTSYVPKYDDADYTQEVVYGDFHLFLPSSFETDNNITFTLPGRDWCPLISIIFLENQKGENTPYYAGMTSQDELRAYYDALIGMDPERTMIQADECYGIMDIHQFDDYCSVTFNIVNLKDSIVVDIVTDFLDEALELAHGILSHAVAKEIPLEELQ